MKYVSLVPSSGQAALWLELKCQTTLRTFFLFTSNFFSKVSHFKVTQTKLILSLWKQQTNNSSSRFKQTPDRTENHDRESKEIFSRWGPRVSSFFFGNILNSVILSTRPLKVSLTVLWSAEFSVEGLVTSCHFPCFLWTDSNVGDLLIWITTGEGRVYYIHILYVHN